LKGEKICDPDKGEFAIKIRDDAIQQSYAWLTDQQLVLVDESDDDIVYGDDDFPDYYGDEEETKTETTVKLFGDIDQGKTTGQDEFKTYDNDAIIGKQIPSLSGLEYLNADKYNAPAAGQVTLVLLWAQFHKPGYKFLPLYSQLQAKYGSKVSIVGVSIDPDTSYAKKFLADPAKKYSTKFPCDFAVAWDSGSLLKRQLTDDAQMAAMSPPHAFLVDSKGVIVWHQDHSELGATAPSYLGLMEDQVDALLAGKPMVKVGDKAVAEYESEGEEAVDIEMGSDGSDDAFGFL
jgi:thiol-disulfide isomerase/thioredoxin